MSSLLKKLMVQDICTAQLREINTELINLHHPLEKTAQNPVFGDGPLYPNLFICGEAPGAEEDKIGKPFVGMAGRILNDALFCAKLARKEVFITNVLTWRPPLNRPPTKAEIEFFIPYLYKYIDIVSPKIILLLGLTPARALLKINNDVSMSKLLYKIYSVRNIPTICCYHPSYLQRIPIFKQYLWNTLRIIIKYVELV